MKQINIDELSYFQKLWLLFSTFFQIALFVVGGGLAMLPVIEEKFVRKYKLLSQEDMLDMIVLTQTIPGLIAINSATFVGNRVAGIFGSIIASIAVMIPSLVIIILIAIVFQSPDFKNPILLQAFNCVRACITGVFFVTALRVAKSVLKSKVAVVLALAYLVALLNKSNPIYIILIAMPIGCLMLFCESKHMIQTKQDADKKGEKAS